ncbi:MAG TPA: aspartate carbamoyltransferase catalytic subunit [Armatimonadota bacterium]|jgi:aspartate carbamoyltransferase catalytic subunit
MNFARRSILGLEGMPADEIGFILDTAGYFREILERSIKKTPVLRGKSICTLFYEASTRTRTSFEIAAKTLSADVSSVAVASSSVTKGESLKDTALTLKAMGVDAFVIRHQASGAPHNVAEWTGLPVINAGDGQHEHPTQGLLDMLTIRAHKGDWKGLKVAIVGDIRHSRVARSGMWGLSKMGADVWLAGPRPLLPPFTDHWPATVTTDIDEALAGADVVNVLRIQLERQEQGLFPTVREYYQRYGITPERLKRCASDVIVMHPGPMNRGIEISDDVADAGYACVEEQVTNGVAVRMALLYLVLGGEGLSA